MIKLNVYTSLAALVIGLSAASVAAACLPDTPEPAPVTEPVPVAQPSPVEYPTVTLPACPEEDSTDCYWDASIRGNGQGTSFINLHGVYYYAR